MSYLVKIPPLSSTLAEADRVPRARYYTRTDNSIDAAVLTRAAEAYRARYAAKLNPPSPEDALATTMRAALREADTMKASPYAQAADAVDAALSELGIEIHDDRDRALTILAYRAGRPCVATRCWNGGTLSTQAINAGAKTMEYFMGRPDLTPAEFLASYPNDLAGIVPLNAGGARVIEQARRIAAQAADPMPMAAE